MEKNKHTHTKQDLPNPVTFRKIKNVSSIQGDSDDLPLGGRVLHPDIMFA